jgi:hypothetical protein
VSTATDPPADFLQLAQQAALHAQLLARLTDTFLAADDGGQADAAAQELFAAVEEARPVIECVLTWWTISQPPETSRWHVTRPDPSSTINDDREPGSR